MKVVMISDTHAKHSSLIMPEGNIVIHSGDFSHGINSANDFMIWYSELDYEYKILVAGNHDFIVERNNEDFRRMAKELGIIYLEDSGIEINGLNFYGSPWTPTYGSFSYMASEEELLKHFRKIPLNTNVLITHGPQFNVLDLVYGDRRVGSRSLSRVIEGLKELKLHCFGHIHESSGMQMNDEYRKYISVNASIVDYYGPQKQPYIVDL